jgi:tRNA A37 methylthiotransferase MiaB
MKVAILTETNAGNYHNNYRGLGAHAVKQEFLKNNVEAIVIDFACHWDSKLLTESLEQFFKDSQDNVIGISVPIQSTYNLDESSPVVVLSNFAKQYKSTHNNTRTIVGGVRAISKESLEYYKHADYVFLGRANEMLDAFINNEDLTKYQSVIVPNAYVNKNYNLSIEKPVIFDMFNDNDFLTEQDIIGFEVALGCKFNCSFCNFPMRNAKNLNLTCEEQLAWSFQTAHDKYGITNFYAADDTLNESNDKLDLLYKVVKQLTFKPQISSFARLDVLSKRPEQFAMMREIGIKSLSFGIETMSEEAARKINKGYNFENFTRTLLQLRNEIPGIWISGCFIAGLNGDTYDNLGSKLELMTNKRLLDNVIISPLIIEDKDIALVKDEGFLSSIDSNPEAYGYKLNADGFWESETTNQYEASEWTTKFISDFNRKAFTGIDAFTWSSVLSQGLATDRNTFWEVYGNQEELNTRIVYNKLYLQSSKYIKEYIKRKSEWMLHLN